MAFWRRAAPEVVRKIADLDQMDSLASAGQALEVEPGLVPSGTGAICYRSTDDRAFCYVEKDARTQLTHDGASTGGAEIRADDHGFKWLMARRAQASYPSLVADLRAASEIFVDKGFGGQLLCAMTVFEGLGQTQAALIYLYRHGLSIPSRLGQREPETIGWNPPSGSPSRNVRWSNRIRRYGSPFGTPLG